MTRAQHAANTLASALFVYVIESVAWWMYVNGFSLARVVAMFFAWLFLTRGIADEWQHLNGEIR